MYGFPAYPRSVPDSAANADLEQFLLLVLAKKVGTRTAKNVPPVQRDWAASEQPTYDIESCVTLNSEATIARLARCKQFTVKRISRSATRGWQAKFQSRKMHRTMKARSHLELRLIELCEVDPEVLAFFEQPIVLRYEMDGKKRTHRPDLYIKTAGTETFVEVKWERDAAEYENSLRWAPIGQTMSKLGFNYSVLSERHILREPRAKNVRAILRGRFEPDIGAAKRAALRQALCTADATITDLVTNYQLTEKQIFRLLLDRFLSIDLDQEITGAAKVGLGSGVAGIVR